MAHQPYDIFQVVRYGGSIAQQVGQRLDVLVVASQGLLGQLMSKRHQIRPELATGHGERVKCVQVDGSGDLFDDTVATVSTTPAGKAT